MEMIEDDPSAFWLPSRHRFALSRLIAFVMFKRAKMKLEVDHLLLAIDRDQSAIETYTLSVWVLAASACYVAAVLPLSPGWAMLLGIPIAAFLLQLPLYFGATSAIMLLLQFCAAAYFATIAGPVHYVAWLSLTIFIANSIAWAVNQACGI
jgi:hypothetical protein